jgi:hypothetical protein
MIRRNSQASGARPSVMDVVAFSALRLLTFAPPGQLPLKSFDAADSGHVTVRGVRLE